MTKRNTYDPVLGKLRKEDLSRNELRTMRAQLRSKANKALNPTTGNFAMLDNEGNPVDSGKNASDFAPSTHAHNQYLTSQSISNMATRAANPTSGNIAVLDSNGNPVDGGIKPNDLSLASHNHTGVYSETGHTHSEYQNKSDNSLITSVKTIVGAINELWNKFTDYLKGIQQVTYAQLVTLRNNNRLMPGQRYHITDFVTTVANDTEARSAGHPFDIIVVADDAATLNENARAVKHTGDAYFADSKLSAWELKYCLDNDVTRFAWADSENGKGVIYFLKDEFENWAEYDLKNVQFKRYRATIKTEYEELLEDSKFKLLQDNDDLWCDINDTVFDLDSNEYIWCYTIHDWVNQHTDGSLGKIDGDVYSPRGVYLNGFSCNRVCVSYDDVELHTVLSLSNIVLYTTLPTGDDPDTEGIKTYNNVFGVDCHNLTISKKCHNCKFTGHIVDSTFGGHIQYTTFGGEIWNTTFGGGLHSCTFGGYIYDSTFGGYINSVTFGGDIQNTTFGGYIERATFGGEIGNTTFGGYIEYTTFGGYIDNVTFGGYINSVTFGGEIRYSTFGGYIVHTTFGGEIVDTTFGGHIQYTTFGGGLSECTFGGNLSNGHIHGYIYSVSVGSAGETWRNLIIDPGVEYVSVTCSGSGDEDITNVHIYSGVCGTDPSPATVTIPIRSNALMEIKPNAKAEILV